MGSIKREVAFFRAKHCVEKVRAPRKSMSSTKKGTHTFSGETMCEKKVWVPKKVWVQKKEIILFRANLAPKKDKKVRAPKKVWVPEKRNLYFYRAQHCAKKSMGSKRKYEFKKKELILFRAKHCAKTQVWDPKKSMSSKTKELILFRAKHCAPKKNGPPQKKTPQSVVLRFPTPPPWNDGFLLWLRFDRSQSHPRCRSRLTNVPALLCGGAPVWARIKSLGANSNSCWFHGRYISN